MSLLSLEQVIKMSETKEQKMSGAIQEQGGEIMNPYTLYEMALGSGLTEAQAKREMQLYCVEVGLDPLCP